MQFLGHVIGKDGIEAEPSRPHPKTSSVAGNQWHLFQEP